MGTGGPLSYRIKARVSDPCGRIVSYRTGQAAGDCPRFLCMGMRGLVRFGLKDRTRLVDRTRRKEEEKDDRTTLAGGHFGNGIDVCVPQAEAAELMASPPPATATP